MKNHKGKSLKDPQKAQVQKSKEPDNSNKDKAIEKDIVNEQLSDQGGTVDLNKKEELIGKAKEGSQCFPDNSDKVKLTDIKNEAEFNLKNPQFTSSQPVNQEKQKVSDIKPSTISTYNGDSCDNYSWSQGTLDVQIQISLPQNTPAKKVIHLTISLVLILLPIK